MQLRIYKTLVIRACLLVVSLAFCVICGGQTGKEAGQPQKGRTWKINVPQPDAAVIVEGLVVGNGSISLDAVPNGTFRLVVEHPDYERYLRDITFDKGDERQAAITDVNLTPGKVDRATRASTQSIVLTDAEKKEKKRAKITKGALKGYDAIFLLPVNMSPGSQRLTRDQLDIVGKISKTLSEHKEVTKIYAPYIAKSGDSKITNTWEMPPQENLLLLEGSILGASQANKAVSALIGFGAGGTDKIDYLFSLRKAGEPNPVLTKYIRGEHVGGFAVFIKPGAAGILSSLLWRSIENGYK